MSDSIRTLVVVLAALAMSACCTEPVVPDFTTPMATLSTFQGAYRNDLPELEYECFGLDLKSRIGSLDLDRYILWRDEALQENPYLNVVLNFKDLVDNVSEPEYGPHGRTAKLFLNLLSKEIQLYFIRETFFRLEFEEGLRPVECRTAPLHPGLIEVSGRTIRLEVADLPPRWIRQLPKSRKLVVEECWKFDGFLFPGEDGGTAPID